MHIAEVVTIAKSLPLLRLNTYKSLILSYSADYRRIFRKNAIFALFFTAPNIIPMILPQVQPNNGIALHLSALYSAIYDNLYF